jgi:polysaccharide biosynthesis protein PslG
VATLRGRRSLLVVCVAAVSFVLPGVASASTPRSFFGVVPQGQLSSRDFERMRGVVGTLRIPVYWFQVEPDPGRYDFSGADELVGEAAKRGVRVLPFVYGSPSWLTADAAVAPQRTVEGRRAWARFLRRLVGRYGPGGAFWRGRSSPRPIRSWQIWNEPNFLLFWRPRPSPSGYVRLLRVAARAIRDADSGARIIAAGVAPVEAGMLPWSFLAGMYRVPGAARSFDLAAVHPYSSTIAGIEYQVRRVRRAMARAGDGAKPLRVTELGVASAGLFPNPFDRGRRGQARYLRRAYRLLLERRRWRIAGVDWFSWQDLSGHDGHCVFCQYAGLFDVAGAPKPAWGAYRSVAAGTGPIPVR